MNTQKDFKIKFRGVRGSYPSAKFNYLKFGGNTACVEVRCGKQLIILDAGTGIIDIGLDEIKNKIVEGLPSYQTTIILSHIHQDHIQGLQFYRPLFIPNSTINLFGLSVSGSLKDSLRQVLFEKVFPLGLDEIRSNFNINNFSQDNIIVISQDGTTKLYDLKDNDIKYKKDDIKITSYKTPAHPKNGCLCIKIEYKSKVLVYATDKESYIGTDKRFSKFALNCDCLIHDAQYTQEDYINPIEPRQGFGHSTFEMALEEAKNAKAKKLFFFHYDPDYDDKKLETLEKEYSNNTASFAKENYEFEI